MSEQNLQVQMARHPHGTLREEDFRFVQADRPVLQPGCVLVRVHYLSLDPYVRPMMDPVRSYVPHLNPGDLMPGLAVGVVEETDVPHLPKGAYVTGRFGWQEWACVEGAGVRIVDPALGPISTSVGVLGMPGATAHYGLLQLGRPVAGDTVVVSAAAGAVGSLVGQIAKLKGCRVVGIAGGPEKCRYAIQELGFDECLDYKAPNLAQRFDAATPDYVNVSFENVGGPIMDMVMSRLAPHARIALCGAISGYDRETSHKGFEIFELVRQRVSMTGFIISEHMDYWPGAFADISRWIHEGKVRYKEAVSSGLRSAPSAFQGLLSGKNFGKQLVQVGSDAS